MKDLQRHGLLLCSVIIACAWGLAAPVAWAQTAAEICPPATTRLDRTVTVADGAGDAVRSVQLRAPTTILERAAVMGAVTTGKGSERRHALIRAGLSGNLEVFEYLLATNDADALAVFGEHYVNADGSSCVALLVERAFRRQLGHPSLGPALLRFFANNTYREARTQRALRRLPMQSMAPSRWLEFAKAIVATRLADAEQRTLKFARSLLPFDSALKNRVLPELHGFYVDYFAARGYRGALVYYRELLQAAGRDEPVTSFQTAYSGLRAKVYAALASMDSAPARRLLIAELDDIGARPLDRVALRELATLVQLVQNFHDRADIGVLVAAYGRVLSVASLPHGPQARRLVYPALQSFETNARNKLFVEQLVEFLTDAAEAADRDDQVPWLLDQLGSAQRLDLDALLPLVRGLNSPEERRLMWRLVAQHPSDAGVSFLLQQLSFALRGGPQALELMGEQAGAELLTLISMLGPPAYLYYARDGIDSLFDQGLLPAADYERASSAIMGKLGHHSQRYLSYQQREAQRRRDEQDAELRKADDRARAALQGTFEAELARWSQPDAVAESLRDLLIGGTSGNWAAQRLVAVGAPALDQLHQALLAPATSDSAKLQLLSVIAEIGAPRSAGPLLEAAASRPDGLLYGPVLAALAQLPATDRTVAFARDQLADGIAPAWKAAALIYLGRIRYTPAAPSVAEYSAAKYPLQVRAAALYLGARLGLPGMYEEAVARLQENSVQERSMLLRVLAETAPSAAVLTEAAIAYGWHARSPDLQQMAAYCAFRTSDPADRVRLAYPLLAQPDPSYRRTAMRYLIEHDREQLTARVTGGAGSVLPLHLLLPRSPPVLLLFSQGRRLGYALEHTGWEYVLRPI